MHAPACTQAHTFSCTVNRKDGTFSNELHAVWNPRFLKERTDPNLNMNYWLHNRISTSKFTGIVLNFLQNSFEISFNANHWNCNKSQLNECSVYVSLHVKSFWMLNFLCPCYLLGLRYMETGRKDCFGSFCLIVLASKGEKNPTVKVI